MTNCKVVDKSINLQGSIENLFEQYWASSQNVYNFCLKAIASFRTNIWFTIFTLCAYIAIVTTIVFLKHMKIIIAVLWCFIICILSHNTQIKC